MNDEVIENMNAVIKVLKILGFVSVGLMILFFVCFIEQSFIFVIGILFGTVNTAIVFKIKETRLFKDLYIKCDERIKEKEDLK